MGLGARFPHFSHIMCYHRCPWYPALVILKNKESVLNPARAQGIIEGERRMEGRGERKERELERKR